MITLDFSISVNLVFQLGLPNNFHPNFGYKYEDNISRTCEISASGKKMSVPEI